MFPMDRKVLQQPVTVEYTARGVRVRKELPDAYAGRLFYARKLREGRNPRIVFRQAS